METINSVKAIAEIQFAIGKFLPKMVMEKESTGRHKK